MTLKSILILSSILMLTTLSLANQPELDNSFSSKNLILKSLLENKHFMSQINPFLRLKSEDPTFILNGYIIRFDPNKVISFSIHSFSKSATLEDTYTLSTSFSLLPEGPEQDPTTYYCRYYFVVKVISSDDLITKDSKPSETSEVYQFTYVDTDLNACSEQKI